MRRSICYCEPAFAKAGEIGTWKFIFTTATSLPKGTKLKFDLQSKGRNIDWQIPDLSAKKGPVLYAILPNGKTIVPKEVEGSVVGVPFFEFNLPVDVKTGNTITFYLGANPEEKKSSKSGIQPQTYVQRRKPFHLYIDTSGKGRFEEPEIFNLDVIGAELQHIKVITPSFVTRNKRFDIVLRFEDEHGNLTSNAPEDTLIELSYENIRENLHWNLFVPETGYITLPNLYFNEVGVYTISLLNTKTKEIFRSPPIRCFNDLNQHLLWGQLHGESEKIDSTDNIESCLRHIRDEEAFNYYGVSPFENLEETSNDTWRLITQNIAEFDENDRFPVFTGFQWIGNPEEEGLRHIVYLKDGKQILRKKELKNQTLKKIYKSFAPKEIISIPSFTMGKGYEYNFEDFNPEYERLVEIYSAWGSSECLTKEGNPVPIKGAVKESGEGSILKALKANHRFGFTAGGLDDRGIFSEFFASDQQQYSPGLTGIIATEHTRNSIGEALFNRACYATTGERIILGFFITNSPMGSEVNTGDKPGLAVNRHISGYVAGTKPLSKIEILCNGKVIKTFQSPNYFLDFNYDDMVPIAKIAIAGKKGAFPFIFYYLRVTQEDGHMAWSSPIWVDVMPINQRALPKRTAKPAKKAVVVEDFGEDEEAFDDTDEDDLD